MYVLYVTGDGGWNGKDVATFEHVRAWGRPVAGFSAPDYLDRLAGQEQTVPPQDLARDFGTILQATAARLGLAPDTPAVLVGVSRGADLVVIAAGEAAIAQRIAGVVAIALTDEEEYVRHPPRHVPHLGHSSSREPALEMARPVPVSSEDPVAHGAHSEHQRSVRSGCTRRRAVRAAVGAPPLLSDRGAQSQLRRRS